MGTEGLLTHAPLLKEHIGRPGHPMPDMIGMTAYRDTADDIAKLAAFGITVVGASDTNTLWIAPPKVAYSLRIDVSLSRESTIVIDACGVLNGTISVTAHAAVAIVCASEFMLLEVTLDGSMPCLYLGPGSYFGGLQLWVQGPARGIVVGEDCMTGWSVGMRTSDFHGIFDVATGKVLNHAKSVVIGPHVWLSHDVLVMRGATIHAGAIVGARAIVSRDVPTRCLAVGAPAQVVRKGVTWDRSVFPDAHAVREIVSRPYMQDEAGAPTVRSGLATRLWQRLRGLGSLHVIQTARPSSGS